MSTLSEYHKAYRRFRKDNRPFPRANSPVEEAALKSWNSRNHRFSGKGYEYRAVEWAIFQSFWLEVMKELPGYGTDWQPLWEEAPQPKTAQERGEYHRCRLAAPLTQQEQGFLLGIALSPQPCLLYDRDSEALGRLFEKGLIQSEYQLIDGGLKYIGLIVLPDGWQVVSEIIQQEEGE